MNQTILFFIIGVIVIFIFLRFTKGYKCESFNCRVAPRFDHYYRIHASDVVPHGLAPPIGTPLSGSPRCKSVADASEAISPKEVSSEYEVPSALQYEVPSALQYKEKIGGAKFNELSGSLQCEAPSAGVQCPRIPTSSQYYVQDRPEPPTSKYEGFKTSENSCPVAPRYAESTSPNCNFARDYKGCLVGDNNNPLYIENGGKYSNYLASDGVTRTGDTIPPDGCKTCGGDYISVAPKRDRYYQLGQGYLGDNILSGYPYYKAY